MNNIMDKIALITTVISFFIVGYVIYLCFDINRKNRLERESYKLNVRENKVYLFSLEEDNITIENKNGFKTLIFRKTKESVLYFNGDRFDDVEILGVEDILKFSSEITSGKKAIEQRFWLNDDNIITKIENNVKDVKASKSEKNKDKDKDDDNDGGGGIDDLILTTVICSLLNWKDN